MTAVKPPTNAERVDKLWRPVFPDKREILKAMDDACAVAVEEYKRTHPCQKATKRKVK